MSYVYLGDLVEEHEEMERKLKRRKRRKNNLNRRKLMGNQSRSRR